MLPGAPTNQSIIFWAVLVWSGCPGAKINKHAAWGRELMNQSIIFRAFLVWSGRPGAKINKHAAWGTYQPINHSSGVSGMARASRDKKGVKGKPQGLASHPKVARRMAPQLKMIGIPIVNRVRNHGVDFTLRGTNRRKLVRAKRWHKAKKKEGRLKRFGSQ